MSSIKDNIKTDLKVKNGIKNKIIKSHIINKGTNAGGSKTETGWGITVHTGGSIQLSTLGRIVKIVSSIR